MLGRWLQAICRRNSTASGGVVANFFADDDFFCVHCFNHKAPLGSACFEILRCDVSGIFVFYRKRRRLSEDRAFARGVRYEVGVPGSGLVIEPVHDPLFVAERVADREKYAGSVIFKNCSDAAAVKDLARDKPRRRCRAVDVTRCSLPDALQLIEGAVRRLCAEGLSVNARKRRPGLAKRIKITAAMGVNNVPCIPCSRLYPACLSRPNENSYRA